MGTGAGVATQPPTLDAHGNPRRLELAPGNQAAQDGVPGVRRDPERAYRKLRGTVPTDSSRIAFTTLTTRSYIPSLSVGNQRPVGLPTVDTIADSLAPPRTEAYTYVICRQGLTDLVLVDDDALRSAAALLFQEMKLAVEPAAVAGLAALAGPLRERLAGKRVGLILCGSNIDLPTYTSVNGDAQQ